MTLDNSDRLFESIQSPDEETPKVIAAWIFRKCEKKDPQNPMTLKCEGATFSHALKMRAAMSYHYAQDEGRGSDKWHQDSSGNWLGNPALSYTVSRYMISLQRRKVTCSMILSI